MRHPCWPVPLGHRRKEWGTPFGLTPSGHRVGGGEGGSGQGEGGIRDSVLLATLRPLFGI